MKNWIRLDCYEATTTTTTTTTREQGLTTATTGITSRGGLNHQQQRSQRRQDSSEEQEQLEDWEAYCWAANTVDVIMFERRMRENDHQNHGHRHHHHPKRRMSCPLHKMIRQRQWSDVIRWMQRDPTQILVQNSQGWSSMTLSLYHSAPADVVTVMLSLLTPSEQIRLLSTPIPNGSRLCLHFAARYATDIETIQQLTESYPDALLVPSEDGILPIDRAIYYRKDASILHYLEQRTKQQRTIEHLRQYNCQLRLTVILCCEAYYGNDSEHPYIQTTGPLLNDPTPMDDEEDDHLCDRTRPTSAWAGESAEGSSIGGKERNGAGLRPPPPEQVAPWIQELYEYCKQRELMGIFWNTLSYVGEYSIPP